MTLLYGLMTVCTLLGVMGGAWRWRNAPRPLRYLAPLFFGLGGFVVGTVLAVLAMLLLWDDGR